MQGEIDAYLAAHGVPNVLDVLIPDANGILRGKQLPGSYLNKLADKGVNMPLSLLFGDVRGATPAPILQPPMTGDPDRKYVPAAGTLKPVPWANVPTAQIFLRPTEKNGAALSIDPRCVLERVLDRFSERGLSPVVALEGEFYLFDPTHSPPRPVPNKNRWPQFEGPQVYALEPLRDVQSYLDRVRETADQQNIPLTAIVCEYGDSQFEMNLDHSSDVVGACDAYLALKHLIRCVSLADGKLASFMAKPLTHAGGSGCHLHVSLLDEQGENAFASDEKKMLHALGGLMATMGEGLAPCAPFANSYRRFQNTGWSPNAANWGYNHRLVSLRIPLSGDKDKRIEHRIAGADVNPFLLVAVVLAGILHGLDKQLDPGPAAEEGQKQPEGNKLPTRWREALVAFEASAVFKEAFGEAFVEMYTRAKYSEEEDFHCEVPDRDWGWCLRTV